MFEFLRVGRHGRLRELLSAYVDGQVSASEASRVREHLAACAECRRELEALRATVSLLRSLPQVQPSRSFALAEAPEPADRRWPVAWGARAAMSVAGLVLAALLLGDAVGLVRQATGREPSLAAMEAEVVVEKEVIKEAPVEVVVEKEVIKGVPVEVVVTQEVIKEVPVEVVVTQEVIKEVPVEVVVTQEVIKEVPVEVVVTQEVIKEVPVEVVVTQEVIKEVMVPAETVVVEKEIVREVSVPGETVVVEKEVVKEVPVEVVVVKEVPVEVVVVKEVQVEAVMEKEVVKEESAPEPAVTPTATAEAQAAAAPAEERGTTTPADVSVPATPAAPEARVAPTAAPPSPGDAGREREEPPVATATPRGVLGPATLPGPVGRPQEARGPEGGIELPLWQMELAAGGLFLVLLLGTLWRARRRGRWR